LANAINAPFGGRSPFSAEVWFVNKTVKRDARWGTAERITVEDPKYKFLIRISAYGNWGFRIDDPFSFITKIVGTLPDFNAQKIEEYFLGEIWQKFAAIVSKKFIKDRVPYSELAARFNEISEEIIQAVSPELSKFGIIIVNFNIAGLETDDEGIRKIQEIQAKVYEMEKFSEVKVTENGKLMKSLDILSDAVKREDSLAGNIAAAGVGLGMSLGGIKQAGEQLGESLTSKSAKSNAEIRLIEIKALLEKGLLSREEFEIKRKEIIDGI